MSIGTEYLPSVARNLHQSRDLGEPFGLNWFEHAPEDAVVLMRLWIGSVILQSGISLIAKLISG